MSCVMSQNLPFSDPDVHLLWYLEKIIIQLLIVIANIHQREVDMTQQIQPPPPATLLHHHQRKGKDSFRPTSS
jgi:hypothetical protein